MAARKSAKSAAKKSPAGSPIKRSSTKAAKRSTTPPSRRWSAKVKTDSTKPGPGLFKESGEAIAEGLAKKSVSPEGPGQAMRMLNFYENRGGKNLSSERKGALEKAKRLLHEKVEAKSASTSRTETAAEKSPSKKTKAKKTSAKKSSTTKASS